MTSSKLMGSCLAAAGGAMVLAGPALGQPNFIEAATDAGLAMTHAPFQSTQWAIVVMTAGLYARSLPGGSREWA